SAQVVFRELPLCLCGSGGSLCPRDRCLRYIDAAVRSVDRHRRCCECCPCGCDGAALSGNLTLLIDNLLLQVVLVGERLTQSILIGPRINGEQKLSLFDQLIVLNRQVNNAAVDFSYNLDIVGSDICVVRSRLAIRLVKGNEQQQDSRRYRYNANSPANS